MTKIHSGKQSNRKRRERERQRETRRWKEKERDLFQSNFYVDEQKTIDCLKARCVFCGSLYFVIKSTLSTDIKRKRRKAEKNYVKLPFFPRSETPYLVKK